MGDCDQKQSMYVSSIHDSNYPVHNCYIDNSKKQVKEYPAII